MFQKLIPFVDIAVMAGLFSGTGAWSDSEVYLFVWLLGDACNLIYDLVKVCLGVALGENHECSLGRILLLLFKMYNWYNLLSAAMKEDEVAVPCTNCNQLM